MQIKKINKGAYWQAWWPEFDHLDPHVGETEPTPDSCICFDTYAHMHIHTQSN